MKSKPKNPFSENEIFFRYNLLMIFPDEIYANSCSIGWFYILVKILDYQIIYLIPFSFRPKNEEEPAAENVDDNQNSLTELDVAEKECCKINF